MPNQNASTAVSAATAAGKFAAGDYVGAAVAAVSAIAGLFGGGGEGYAQSVGYEIKGTVSGGKLLPGNVVTGLTSNGIHNYRISEAEGAYGERGHLDAEVARLWKQYFPDNPSDVSFPIDFTAPYEWLGVVEPTVEKIFGAVANQRASEKSLLDLFKGATPLSAPDVAAITGAPIDPSGATIAPGAAAITGAGAASSMPVNMLSNNPILIAAALLALLFIMKGK